jgi:hypothetical protein
MSDLKKLDAVEGFVTKWVAWAKQNTMVAGFIIAGVPAILGAGYTGITKFNQVKEMYEGYSGTAKSASNAEKKVTVLEEIAADKRELKVLEEKVATQREVIAKMQERLAEALMAAREAKILAESAQKELRSGLASQKVELDVTTNTLRSEMNTLKRATTNRLGQ